LPDCWPGYIEGGWKPTPEEKRQGMWRKDPYEILGVSRDASAEEVRRAYRGQTRKHHPDVNPDDPQAEERFKELNQAYEVLANPGKRRNYDERFRVASQRRRKSPRMQEGRRPGSGDAYEINLADLLTRLGGSSGAREESGRKLHGEDALRLARLFGVDLDRLSKLLGEAVTVKAHATFEEGGSGTSGASYTSTRPRFRKPPIPRKPPKPPKTV
jgi:curved DNA-binding protein CbpA